MKNSPGFRLLGAGMATMVMLALSVAAADVQASQSVSYPGLTATFGTPTVTLNQLDPASGERQSVQYELYPWVHLGGVNDAIDVDFARNSLTTFRSKGGDLYMSMSLPASFDARPINNLMVNTVVIVQAASPVRIEGALKAWRGDEMLHSSDLSFSAGLHPNNVGHVLTRLLPYPERFDRLELSLALPQARPAGSPEISIYLSGMQFTAAHTPPVVPEPGAGGLMLLGGGALGLLARSRRRASR